MFCLVNRTQKFIPLSVCVCVCVYVYACVCGVYVYVCVCVCNVHRGQIEFFSSAGCEVLAFRHAGHPVKGPAHYYCHVQVMCRYCDVHVISGGLHPHDAERCQPLGRV